jgi:hypothetical protein
MIFELKKEIAIFLSDGSNSDANFCCSEDFIQKLTYLVDMFEKLNNLDISMQGSQNNILNQTDEGCIRKKVRKRNFEYNIFDMFPTFERCQPSSETEANERTFHQPLGCFAETVFIVF